MQLPISTSDYFCHKNAIDLLIREIKTKYPNEVDQWKFEMLNTFPGSYMLSDSSNFLTHEMLMELLKITTGENDPVLSVFGQGTFSFHLERLSDSIETFLFATMKNERKRPVLEKLCATSLDAQAKLVIGLLIQPEMFAKQYGDFFLDESLTIPSVKICDIFIDWAVSHADDSNLTQKLFSMGNAAFAGLSSDEFSTIDSLIQESVDENGIYDEVLGMQKINQYFGSKKHFTEEKQKKN